MFSTLKKFLTLSVAMLSASLLVGCAPPPDLALKGITPVKQPFDARLVSVEAEGLAKPDFFLLVGPRAKEMGSLIPEFLKKGLEEANLFDPKGKTPVRIMTKLKRVDAPKSMNFPTDTSIEYLIIDENTGKEVLRKYIQVTDFAEFTSLVGLVRAHNSFDKSVRSNMMMFINTLKFLNQKKQILQKAN